MRDDHIEFSDAPARAVDSHDDLLEVGREPRPVNRARRTAGVVLALAGLTAAVVWTESGSPPSRASVHTKITVTASPADHISSAVPDTVQRSLTTAFGAVTAARVQTIFAGTRVGASDTAIARFVCRLITARSGPFHVQVLAVRRTAQHPEPQLHASATPPGSVYSFEESHRAGYVIDIFISGPNAMSLTRFDGDPQLLDGLLSDS